MKKKPEELSWSNLKSYHGVIFYKIILKNILDVQSCVVKSHTAFLTHSLHMHVFRHHDPKKL